ncbi:MULTISPECIES: hypothetical protein [Halomonas]|nr:MULTISPECIES: hypothetical protein [Halomonas]MDR5860423.1 hypothetical protein [Halomonas eurihalina]WBF16558.1 hypothetical protein LM502_10675 [Halomonas elongata]WPU48999.1 hypothetical protein SR933_08900 [Halomonas elongata DSM 2581]
MVLISPELLIGVLVFCFFSEYPEIFVNITAEIKEGSNIPDIVSVLPFSFVAISYQLGMGVIRPGDEEENKLLYEWPYYWMLEHRFYGSLIICILCSISVIFFYLNPTNMGDAALGGILTAAISISATTVFLLAIARLTLRKILTLYR